MPFKKVRDDDYTSPSGRHFNGAQVRLWHARGGKFPGQKGSEMNTMAKGHRPMDASYAQGGAVLGRTRDFMKTPDEFREDRSNKTDEVWGKGSSAKNPKAADKSLKPVKPRA
jgi:hypothetical protein